MNAREKQYVIQIADIWRELMGIKAVLKDHGELDHEMGELEESDQEEEGVVEDTDM
jgi:hypothetical protein